MTRWIHIRTDDRVADIARNFEAAPGWEVVGPIDSANWGEGYDLNWRGVPVRLHDEERSGEVSRRLRSAPAPGEWDRLFLVVAGEIAGDVTLTFAIDHWGESEAGHYPDVAEAISAVLVEAGYDLGSITAEASR